MGNPSDKFGFSEEAMRSLERAQALDDEMFRALGPQLADIPTRSPRSRAPERRPSEARGDRPHYFGHRERLRQRFAQGGLASLQEYELLEMILFNAVPRIDVKPLAKALLEEFGGFAGLVSAPREQLRASQKTDEKIIHQLKLAEAIAISLSTTQLREMPLLDTSEALLAYARTVLSHRQAEHFRVLFLDRQLYLIADEEMGRGTVAHVPVYPREVVKRALELNASTLILLHNHPSGDPTPSRGDYEGTKAIKSALGTVQVELAEHLVVGKGREFSFRAEGLLD